MFYDKVIKVDDIPKEEDTVNDNDLNEEITEEENQTVKKTYNNLQKDTIKVYPSNKPYYNESKNLSLEIVDGKLIAKLESDDVNVNGLEGNIESFIYEVAGCDDSSPINVVAINGNNELFYANVNGFDKDDYITFQKLNISEKVVDIEMTDFNIGFSTCGKRNNYVILENGKEHPLLYNLQETSFTIDTNVDISEFKTIIPQLLVVYDDNTIGKWDSYGKYEGDFKNKLQYNGRNLIVSKLYNRYRSYDSQDDSDGYKYIISNNKLYELDVTYTDGITIDKIEVKLVNDSNIKNESIDTSNEEKYDFSNDKKDITITFENGETFTIENVYTVYNFD